MANAVRASTTALIALGSGVGTVTLPGPPIADDLIVVILGNQIITAYSTLSTAGYTTAKQHLNVAAGNFDRVSLFIKKMGGTPDTTVDVNKLPSNSQGCLVYTMSGQDLTTPEDAAGTTAEAASGAIDGAAITTATANAWALVLGNIFAVPTPTAPTGYGDLLHVAYGGATAKVMAAWKAVVAAGSENPGAFGSGGSADWAAITWALRPAAAAGGTTEKTPGGLHHIECGVNGSRARRVSQTLHTIEHGISANENEREKVAA